MSVKKSCIRGGGKLKVNYFKMLSQRYDKARQQARRSWGIPGQTWEKDIGNILKELEQHEMRAKFKWNDRKVESSSHHLYITRHKGDLLIHSASQYTSK